MFVLKKTHLRQVKDLNESIGYWRNRYKNADREATSLANELRSRHSTAEVELARLRAVEAEAIYDKAVVKHKAATSLVAERRKAYEDALNAKRSPNYGRGVTDAAALLASALTADDAAQKLRQNAWACVMKTRQDYVNTKV